MKFIVMLDSGVRYTYEARDMIELVCSLQKELIEHIDMISKLDEKTLEVGD